MRTKPKATETLSLLFGLLLVLAGGCSTTPPTQQTVSILLASGFKEVPATTPARLAQLEALRSGKITAKQRGGKTWYVFPDAAHKKLYVGNPDQYQSYVQAFQDEQLSRGISRAGLVVEDEISTVIGADDPYGE
jgi:hypothetical protein